MQFGWSRADFKPLKARFFWLCGAAQPQAGVAAVAAELLALPQFPCKLQTLGWSQGCCLTSTLSTCEVTPPCVRVHCRALKGPICGTKPSWLQHKACGSSSSLFLTFPQGHHLSPFRFFRFQTLFFGTFPSTSSCTGCFLFSLSLVNVTLSPALSWDPHFLDHRGLPADETFP